MKMKIKPIEQPRKNCGKNSFHNSSGHRHHIYPIILVHLLSNGSSDSPLDLSFSSYNFSASESGKVSSRWPMILVKAVNGTKRGGDNLISEEYTAF